MASNASDVEWYGQRSTAILCKNTLGETVPWPLADEAQFHHYTQGNYGTQHGALTRVAQLFNVNHFIVSQARPYMVPFLQSSMHTPDMRWRTTGWLSRLTRAAPVHAGLLMLRHHTREMARQGYLPVLARRLFLDEALPAASILLVPRVPLRDYLSLLDSPTKASLQYWIRRGEQCVWPAVAALKIRCSVELALNDAYASTQHNEPDELRTRGVSAGRRRLP